MNIESTTAAETLSNGIERLSSLLSRSTPGRPEWFVKEDDLIGGTCIMPVDLTPANASNAENPTNSVGDFMNEDDAELIVALRNAAPAILSLMTLVLNTHTDIVPLPFDDDSAPVWPVPVGVLRVALALAS